MSDALHWFIVLAFAGAEWQAYRNLQRRGIEAYHAMVISDARRGRWDQAVGKPQFPGYLFASGSAGAIRDTIGVRDLLRQGQDVVSIQSRAFETIRAACDKRALDALPVSADAHRWHVGDVVPLPTSGPLAGAPVLITAIDKGGRISAELGSRVVTFHVNDALIASAQSVRARAAL